MRTNWRVKRGERRNAPDDCQFGLCLPRRPRGKGKGHCHIGGLNVGLVPESGSSSVEACSFLLEKAVEIWRLVEIVEVSLV